MVIQAKNKYYIIPRTFIALFQEILLYIIQAILLLLYLMYDYMLEYTPDLCEYLCCKQICTTNTKKLKQRSCKIDSNF